MPPKSNEEPINSEFEFWTEFPNEILTECIKRMDFKTRMQLRATSKKDKELVEAAPKYEFDIVFVDLEPKWETITCEKFDCPEIICAFDESERKSVFLKKLHFLFVHILKFSIVNNLDFSSDFTDDIRVWKFLANISRAAPFHFKKINFLCNKFEIVEFFLENCISAESIGFERTDFFKLTTKGFNETNLYKFLDLPVVTNVKTLQLIKFEQPRIPFKIIKKWLSTADLKLGKTLCLDISRPDEMIDFLKKKFRNRIVRKTDEILRLRTNDATKHILIRDVTDRYYDGQSYYLFRVIPFDQKESEYEKDDEWMNEIKKMAECREEGIYRYTDDILDYEHEPFSYDSDDYSELI